MKKVLLCLPILVSCAGGSKASAPATASREEGERPRKAVGRSASDSEGDLPTAGAAGPEATRARDEDDARARASRAEEREASEKARREPEPSTSLPGGAPPPPPPPKPAAPSVRAPAPSSPGVKAGASDDNLQFNAFLDYLSGTATEREGLVRLSQRVMLRVRDNAGLPVASADVSVSAGGKTLLSRRTYADGRALLVPPSPGALDDQSAKAVIRYAGQTKEVFIGGAGRKHILDVSLAGARAAQKQVPLDIAFVLDTTGSMGDEIDRLRQTLEVIHFQITNLSPKPEVRFGMVLFKDHDEDYVTRVVPFTGRFDEFQRALGEVSAGGGGDYPEDVNEALKDAIEKLAWSTEGVRLAFLIGDAPPHQDYGQTKDFRWAMERAAERGIKFASIGASGLDPTGEMVWRRLAQYTMGPFVFLTYGESGDSEGTPSTVSHHVGSNWVAENLDAIIIRMVKVELAHFAPKAVSSPEDYFSATKQPGVDAEATLADLFQQSTKQLVAYSVERIEGRTPTVVLPIAAKGAKLDALAERLEARLAIGLASAGPFQLVENKNLPDLLKTVAGQLSDVYDTDKMVEAGKLVPARLAVLTRLDDRGASGVELLVKLVRLETGEVLSLSLVKIDRGLLL